jgi:hypothetical protein
VYEGIAGPIDRAGFAEATVEASVAGFLAAVASPRSADPRIHHLRYQDFTADPVAAIRDLYDDVELEFGDSVEGAMRRWMAENPSNRFGRFRYSLDGLAFDVDALDDRLQPYRDRFGVAREPRKH